MSTLARWFIAFSTTAALSLGSTVLAEVATHGDAATSGPNMVILETTRIVDGDGPIPSLWEPLSDPSERIHVLNDGGATNADGHPSIVLHPQTRIPFAAWAARTPGGYDIVVSRFVDGAWTAPLTVAGGVLDEIDVHLVADPSAGTLHVFYGVVASTLRIEHRFANADGTVWSDIELVSTDNIDAVRPSATFHDGRLLVTYEGQPSAGTRQIMMAERDEYGWLSETIADTFYTEPSHPQIHSNGARVWIDWVDAPGAMRWSCRESDGPWTPLATEPFSGMEDREYHVRGRIKRSVREQ